MKIGLRCATMKGPTILRAAGSYGSGMMAQRHCNCETNVPATGDTAVEVRCDGISGHRRGFLAAMFGSAVGVGFASLGAVLWMWTVGVARFMFPNTVVEPPTRFKVGRPEDFAPETVDERFKAEQGVWIVDTFLDGRRRIVALRAVCTHLRCTPNWLSGQQKFKCPCHGSGFGIQGINHEGPARGPWSGSPSP